MSNRTLRLLNFKSIEDKTFNLDGDLVVFVGKNGTGKSTAIQAIETVLLEKNFVKNPIRTGQDEAKIEYSGNDLEGNPIKVLISINDEGNYDFSAAVIVGTKMKTIHDAKRIRELLGTYYPLTVEDTLAMIKYAEGRREFIQKYLLPLLSETQRNRLAELQLSVSDKKTKAAEDNLYNTRTQLNKEIETLNAQILAAKLSDEEKLEVEKKKIVSDRLSLLEADYTTHQNDGAEYLKIKTSIESLTKYGENVLSGLEMLNNEYEIDFSEQMTIVNDQVEAKKEELIGKQDKLYSDEVIKSLAADIERGRTKKLYIEGLEKKKEPKDLMDQMSAKFTKAFEIGEQIDANKAEIKAIFTNSNLPAGLQIDEETIMLNDMLMDETVTSNTEARLAIVELLCNLSTAEYVQIGDLSLYDTESRNKLIAMAKKHNRIMMGQLVSDDAEVTLKVIVEK